MSPRRNWDSPNPSLASECALQTGGAHSLEWGGAHSPAGEGLGESQFRRLEKKLSNMHCLLCGNYQIAKCCHLNRFEYESFLKEK
jgi:hypothetical protein